MADLGIAGKEATRTGDAKRSNNYFRVYVSIETHQTGKTGSAACSAFRCKRRKAKETFDM